MRKRLYKKSEITSTAPLYEDATGTEFTAKKIISEGFKPKRPYKIKSLSSKVTSPDFGKVKK